MGSLRLNAKENSQKATFAGGCFWCMEPPFEQLDGVTKVISGYTGGRKKNPTYEEVCSGSTGHLEAIQVTYDSSKTSYAELLDIFWRSVDPTDAVGQFADKGTQYQTAIFYHAEEQRKLAEMSKQELAHSGKFDQPIVTQIRPAGEFYPAEEYHQGYYLKNPEHYKSYKYGSGREPYLKKMWRNQERACPLLLRNTGTKESSSNRLIHEKSPYLLQHAHNPVDWYPWGGEAFDKARKEDKPIFLSIGYSTCHW
ncbi:MAG: peptide-methionine (S)-S-oxide reductase MsrA, partial [Candidatus Omnitrophica bacterium]|nr:peptide-methionine (S)-S-oxide reductase MsrA [Candidatus Omnitrophota bacterium]